MLHSAAVRYKKSAKKGNTQQLMAIIKNTYLRNQKKAF
jgi:hypothetical protein